MEIAEMADHPFMLGTQFHPEFLSRPNRPHPLFVAFMQAACEQAGVKTNGIESFGIETSSNRFIDEINSWESDSGFKYVLSLNDSPNLRH